MKYYISLGGNIEPREQYIHTAKQFLSHHGEITQESALYETEALGPLVDGKPQAWHVNQVIELTSDALPIELAKELKRIEQQTGRQQREKWGPREIDIDILCIADMPTLEIVETPHLIIPHPRMQERNFVLTPLADIAPDYLHPLLQKTIAELRDACEDTLEIKPYTTAND